MLWCRIAPVQATMLGRDSISRTTSRKFLIPLLASAFLAAPVEFGPAMAQHGGSHGVNYNSSKSNSGNVTAGNKTGAGKGQPGKVNKTTTRSNTQHN